MPTRDHRAKGSASLVRRITRRVRCGVLFAFVASSVVVALQPAAWSDDGVPASLATVPAADATAPQRSVREYLIKAAILYNLAKFASWPNSAFNSDQAAIRICVLGVDPFGPALTALQGKQVGQRPLKTAVIEDVDNVAACHVLFISASETNRLGEILAAIARLPIVTVADMTPFTAAGGMVRLTQADGRSGLEVNVGAAADAGVSFSSKLLRLANTVDPRTAVLDRRRSE